MAETERAELTRYIDIIRSRESAKTPLEIESVFVNLELLNRDKIEDLWKGLAESLLSNPDLQEEEVRRFNGRRDLSRQGYWWWNPKAWAKRAKT